MIHRKTSIQTNESFQSSRRTLFFTKALSQKNEEILGKPIQEINITQETNITTLREKKSEALVKITAPKSKSLNKILKEAKYIVPSKRQLLKLLNHTEVEIKEKNERLMEDKKKILREQKLKQREDYNKKMYQKYLKEEKKQSKRGCQCQIF